MCVRVSEESEFKMSQHFNSMLEHLKMGNRRTSSNNTNNTSSVASSGPSNQCQTGNGGGDPSWNSEKSPISALIQKFSSCSSSSSSAVCPATTGAAAAAGVGGASIVATSPVNCNNHINSQQSGKVNVNLISRRDSSTKGGAAASSDEVDCSATITNSCGVLRINSSKVNNNNGSNNKLGVVHSKIQCPEESSTPTLSAPLISSGRKLSDAGLRGLLHSGGEDKNGTKATTTSITLPNGHIINATRKLSADFRLNHRGGDLLNEDGKHFSHKPVRVKNLANKTEAYDMMHNKTIEKVSEMG